MRTAIFALVVSLLLVGATVFAGTSTGNHLSNKILTLPNEIIAVSMEIVTIPTGIAAFVGIGTDSREPDRRDPEVLEAALAWVRRGVGIVPVSRTLKATFDPVTRTTKFAPIPTIRWQQDGPLRTAGQVRARWSSYPGDQLAIVLENPEVKLVCCDVDLKKLPSGVAPEGRPIPQSFGGQYVERSKSDGRHYLAAYTTSIPEWVGGRWTSLGGYVDVLARGILFCAPSHFVKPDGVDSGRCEVLTDGPIPSFSGIGEPIARWADWLYPAWLAVSQGGDAPAGDAAVAARKVAPVAGVAEVLERMRRASDAGKIAAWICENTDGESRDWDLCPKLVVHALEAGASADQAAEVVGCPYWPPRRVEAIKLTRAAGVPSLLKHTEGKAAYAALRGEASSPLARQLRRYSGLPWRSVRDILGEGP